MVSITILAFFTAHDTSFGSIIGDMVVDISTRIIHAYLSTASAIRSARRSLNRFDVDAAAELAVRALLDGHLHLCVRRPVDPVHGRLSAVRNTARCRGPGVQRNVRGRPETGAGCHHGYAIRAKYLSI